MFRNKLDEDGKMVRNKTMLITERLYNQQEGINLCTCRLEAIKVMFAFVTHKNIKFFQMDVKKQTFTKQPLVLKIKLCLNTFQTKKKYLSMVLSMHHMLSSEFEMSMMGELRFFLSLQIK
ncbi:hypothetical protein CR513_47177, partial [Mucuna pruriens]